MIIAGLVLLGLAFGSFVNALVWRIYKQEQEGQTSKDLSITKGRSQCVHCGHKLSAMDLLPVISWLSLKGRCRYCNESISRQYPAVELLTAALFVISYYFWPLPFDAEGIFSLALWLTALVGLIALIIYDIRWMILPNRIVFLLLAVTFIGRIIELIIWEPTLNRLLNIIGGALIGGGVFYILFQVSSGKWIGGGDVKLGFLLGLLIANPLGSAFMLFLSSLIGTIFILPLLLSGKANRKSRIPYGPFLILAAGITVLFGADMQQAYISLLEL